MTNHVPTSRFFQSLDASRLVDAFDLEAISTGLQEQRCLFFDRDEHFSIKAVLDALSGTGRVTGVEDEIVLHTLWHCLACGACSPSASRGSDSFAALALQARRILVAAGQPPPSLFRGALASLCRLAQTTGGLRPKRLVDGRVWPEGKTVYWTGRMGQAAALFDAEEAERVVTALRFGYRVLDEAGLEPVLLDPEPCLDFESAWWGDRETFMERAGRVGEVFSALGSVRVVAADPLSASLLQWVFDDQGLDLKAESLLEVWSGLESAVSRDRVVKTGGKTAREPVALLPEPSLNLSFLTDDPVLDTWRMEPPTSLVEALGFEPVVLFSDRAGQEPGTASVGLRTLATVSAPSAALCRELLQEADRHHARKVVVADPMVWAALVDVSRAGTWRQASAKPMLPAELGIVARRGEV